jgi:lipid II:glycine glycyltransferase (peptidoglycan interpeptide bridge formation enzyme)
VRVSRDTVDDAWDAFVDTVPGGGHLQTTAWARVKATAGWRATRIVLTRDDAVVGGLQLLCRDLPVGGSIGYVPRGPLEDAAGPARLATVLDALDEVAGRERLILVKLQPPPGGDEMVPALTERGFAPSALEAAPTATVVVDLRRPESAILAAMRSSVRSNIAKSRRKGVTVRAGSEADLPRFSELVAATSRRQGFDPYPPGYYRAIWRSFHPIGRARLLLAEHDGAVLSALLLVAHGDTVVYKMGGWGGSRPGLHPNELAHWTAMQWARERGYAQYDLEGIDLPTARAIARGDAVSAGDVSGLTHFKLGFGGEVVVLPGAHDRPYRRVAALASRPLAWGVAHSGRLTRRLAGRRR